jgi:hypothetical protein
VRLVVRTRTAACALVLCTFAGVARPACALALDELMRELASVPERHATFEETKQIALLNGPLVRRGTLDYVAPGRLTMRVESPYFERLDISGDELVIERRSGVSRVTLSSQPALAAWVESLRATLAGDGAALQARFAVAVDGTAAQWRLDLTPRDAALRATVARVAIAGRGADVVRFEVEETKGDSTRVVISPRTSR